MRKHKLLGVVLCLALAIELAVYAAHRPSPPRDPLVGARAYTGDRPSVYEGGGTTRFHFDAPYALTDALRIDFSQSLNGAKVNVTGHAGCDAVPLLREQRINAKRLDILWQHTGYDWIEVEVLNHHRPPPALHEWAWFDRGTPSKIGD